MDALQPRMPPLDELRSTVSEAGLQIAARSGRGGREHNEDSLNIIPAGAGVLLAVADGLGGHQGGEIASNAFCQGLATRAAEHLTGAPEDAALSRLYEAAAADLQQVITRSYAQAARTTCALAWVHPQGIITLTVGDTRVYILREGEIGSWRSRDHSVAELALHDIPQEGAAAVSEIDRSRLYKSLGLKSIPEPALTTHPPLGPRDSVVVCSDGVWGCVAVDDLLDLGASADLPAAVDAVVERAIAFAGADADNATLLVARPQTAAASPAAGLARAAGLLRGSLVTLPVTGSFMVLGVLRATAESVTYLMQNEQEQVQWLKVLDLQLQPGELSEAYLPGAHRPTTSLCPALERAQTQDAQLVALGPTGATPLGWPAHTPAPLPADFPRNAFLALADCHREGIIHGAIRPRNITWRPNGRVVLLEPRLRKAHASGQQAAAHQASVHQDVVDLLRVCCALEQPGAARRAQMQALIRVEKLTAADVVAALDGRSGADSTTLVSWLRTSLPALAIAAAVILAWGVLRPYGQIAPAVVHPQAAFSAGPQGSQSPPLAPAASTGPQTPTPSSAATAALATPTSSPPQASDEARVRLQITSADGETVPASTVRVWVNELPVDAAQGFSVQRRNYNLVVEATGYERYERPLDTRSGGQMEVPVQLQKIVIAAPEPKPGPSTVSAEPAAAEASASSPASIPVSIPGSIPGSIPASISGARPADKPACSDRPDSAPSCLDPSTPACGAPGDAADCTRRDESVTPHPEAAPPLPKPQPSSTPAPAMPTGPTGPTAPAADPDTAWSGRT